MPNKLISTKNVIAIVIGNALEWYDFVVYSFLTVIIAKLFFPSANATTSILAATATFGVAFCLRPLGGIVLGVYADRRGRKAAIMLVIALMTLAVLMICIAPTYAQIGIWAPIIIVLARMLQGFSTGGEFAVSTALLIEMSPPDQRGYYGSWQMMGQMLAMLLGAMVGVLLTHVFSIEEVEAFGWRIPFMVGLIIAPVGLFMRKNLKETHLPAVKQNQKFWQTMRMHWQQILIAMGLVVGGTVAVYVNISYLPTYVVTYLHLPLEYAFVALGVSVLIMVTLIPLFGSWSDSVGRKPIMLAAIFSYLMVIYPLFSWLTAEPTLARLIAVEFVCCLLLGIYFGVFATAVAELFPVAIRSSGLGISYNLTVMLFGGFAQFIVTWLIDTLETPMAITYYLMAALGISLVAAIFYQEPHK